MTPNLQMLKVISAQAFTVYSSSSLNVIFKPSILSSPGAARQVFMAESDASNFFSQKRRSRRSPKYYAEVQGRCSKIWPKPCLSPQWNNRFVWVIWFIFGVSYCGVPLCSCSSSYGLQYIRHIWPVVKELR